MSRVVVFCSTSEELSPLFYSEYELIGEVLAADGHEVVWNPKGRLREAESASADAFVVLPGGLDTLNQTLEVLALKSHGNLEKPVIFYNYLGVWTPLLEALELLSQQRLIPTPLSTLLRVLDKPEALRENLKHAL